MKQNGYGHSNGLSYLPVWLYRQIDRMCETGLFADETFLSFPSSKRFSHFPGGDFHTCQNALKDLVIFCALLGFCQRCTGIYPPDGNRHPLKAVAKICSPFEGNCSSFQLWWTDAEHFSIARLRKSLNQTALLST